MSKLILITGGQRSGKSTYAENLALSLSPTPVYLATAHVWDDEFQRRVDKHKERRGPQWSTIEEEFSISKYDYEGKVVLLDCLTLWSTNFFFRGGVERDIEVVLTELKGELDTLLMQNVTLIVVTNEIGMGGTSANAAQRHFTDLLGWLNQYVASVAQEVVLMVSGIPVKIK